MLQPRSLHQRNVRSIFENAPTINSRRHASLTSAIGKGVRRAGAALKKAESRRVKEGTLGFWELKDRDKINQARKHVNLRNENERRLNWLRQDSEALFDDEQSLRSSGGDSAQVERPKQLIAKQDEETNEDLIRLARLRAQGVLIDAPTSIPYTEATSEFVYGTFAVLAALSANRRRLHRLYIDVGQDDLNLPPKEDEMTKRIVALARKHKVQVERIAGKRVRMLDRMAGNRPHNGLVLEASPIIQIPIRAFEQVQANADKVRATLGLLSDEDKLALGVDPKQSAYHFTRKDPHRAPLMLWLDRITDTGNMGAIVRTAFFLGVDGIILPSHGTAPISAVSVKASAGAAEMVKIFSIGNELDFMTRSQQNGWVFFAAAAPEVESKTKRPSGPASSIPRLQSPLPNDVIQNSPCVLILGNEGEGLRTFLQRRADHLIGIGGTESDSNFNIVDSLNVSVAAALLIDRFLTAKMHVRYQQAVSDVSRGIQHS